MPSPFPGMDPFLESQDWEDFHTRFNTALSETLAPAIEPRYVVRVERRVYVEGLESPPEQQRRADVAILHAGDEAPAGGVATAAATALAPVECLVPLPEEHRETYLVIRERGSQEVVTIVETLSPANKRPGSVGQKEYLAKRLEVFRSFTHLVELDLLRGGQRMPLRGKVPAGDYYAVVSRSERRPRVAVYAWPVLHRLPSIPVPLRGDDPEAMVDLQTVFATVYDRARYHLSLDYTRPLDPPLREAELHWLRERGVAK